jgi:uncharacterized protein (TIGR00645 family)
MNETAPYELLGARNLQVDLGGATILRNVSLSIGPGERVAIVWPNGAGKTTLMRALSGAVPSTSGEVTLQVLELLDVVLLGNLIIIILFAGYENFVSKIKIADGAEDRPHWMGHVDFSGLKIKLIGSLVAISVIELLKDFMQEGPFDPKREGWRIGIHMTFVISGVLFALMDNMADRHKSER